MEKRLEFSLQMKGFLWDNVFITDECLFYLHRNTIKFWAKSKDKPHKKMAKKRPSIMVWGALSLKGLYITTLDGNINSEKYFQLVSDFIPFANALYPDGWVLQQDGARPHTSKKTLELFQEKSIQKMQWPVNSPDLSPIKNMWFIMKTHIEKVSPATLGELKLSIKSIAESISRQTQVNLVNSIPRRLQLCIAYRGGVPPY